MKFRNIFSLSEQAAVSRMAQEKNPGFSNRFTFASLPRTERGQPIVLGNDPKGENLLYCHGNR